MSELHTKITAEVSVLSPLHIGTGARLQRDFDWTERNGRIFVFNHDVLFETVLSRAEAEYGTEVAALTTTLMEMTISDLEKAGWLERKDFRDEGSPLFRYVLRGQPHLNEIAEQIKDVYGHPYLPGSSLKGALRTVLAWGIYTKTKRQPDLRRLRRSRSWAAQPLEQAIFGPDPNRDWLRALQVADSPPLELSCLQLEGVHVYHTARQGRPGLDLDVETIKEGTTFTMALTVDEYGFQEEVAPKLRWQGQRRWLDQLATLGREHARQRLLSEADYLNSKGGPIGVKRFYDSLIHTWSTLAENEFIVQLGWGGGWESKTLGNLLKQDERTFEKLLADYRMVRQGTRRRAGDPFPASRRLALRSGKPALPMGWVKVKLEVEP